MSLFDLPRRRFKNQFYIFVSYESQYHSGDILKQRSVWTKKYFIPDNFFNATMSYRKDSDITAASGVLSRLTDDELQNRTSDHEEIVRSIFQRPKSLLQFVSHCETMSRREIYINELKKYIDVTVFGKCSGRRCSKECDKRAVAEHKFYLSFENSVCRDYITEKMYDRIGNLLPVVLRRSTYKGIIPDEAFIAADDFNCPKDLANYLNYLSSNYTAFSKYFEWRKRWKIELKVEECELCRFVQLYRGKTKTLPSIRKWLYHDSDCKHFYGEQLTCGG
ncbi:unnamed protein product [Enterobius vermicularis]|uniref:Fucosyltransferase n=1 Tax=Enterobius vermicularis TaxID=51028 RepID=A0A0N4VIC2_ENTVE|nr:unnamed protein product [Enterobius vermicularis]